MLGLVDTEKKRIGSHNRNNQNGILLLLIKTIGQINWCH
jgi:hypothetical protein